MSSAKDEPLRDNHENAHPVTITRDFYIGVFETTEGQYDRIVNGTASASCYPKPTRYDDVRGADIGATWPTYIDHRVDASSFLGLLRKKTGGTITFDIPTEAQWEMASRDKGDGTYHGSYVLNDGVSFYSAETNIVGNVTNIVSNTDWSHLGDLAWYNDQTPGTNEGAAHEVGLKLPSTSGLYDLHGNLWELCLDFHGNLPSSPQTDPVGLKYNTKRVRRGGSFWKDDLPGHCRISKRLNTFSDDYGDDSIGFRIIIVR